MDKQWLAARDLVFQEVQRHQQAGGAPTLQIIVDLILDGACRAGVDVRHESTLEQMKTLLVDAFRAAAHCGDRAATSSLVAAKRSTPVGRDCEVVRAAE